MKKQILSFKNAFKGIGYAIKSEGHMRFHLVAAFYVLLLSPVCKLSADRIALLVFLISAVIAFELLNTCIERLCDYTAERYEPVIRLVKDVSSSAVLVLSIAAVIIAVLFFLNFEALNNLWMFFADNIGLLIALAVCAVASFLFVLLGPDGIGRLRKKKK